MEWPAPASTSMPLRITGGVASALAMETAVVVVGEREPLLVGADREGEGDFPLTCGCCVAAGDVLVGERLDTDDGLLLLLLPSLVLGTPASYGLKLTGLEAAGLSATEVDPSDTTRVGLLPLALAASPDFSERSLLLPVSAPIWEQVCASSCSGDLPLLS